MLIALDGPELSQFSYTHLPVAGDTGMNQSHLPVFFLFKDTCSLPLQYRDALKPTSYVSICPLFDRIALYISSYVAQAGLEMFILLTQLTGTHHHALLLMHI